QHTLQADTSSQDHNGTGGSIKPSDTWRGDLACTMKLFHFRQKGKVCVNPEDKNVKRAMQILNARNKGVFGQQSERLEVWVVLGVEPEPHRKLHPEDPR
ncbi:hypothetical protein A6R68_06834, partial [Neotoma lepida]